MNPLSCDVLSPRSLLLGIVRLIHSDPVLILSNQSRDTNANAVASSSEKGGGGGGGGCLASSSEKGGGCLALSSEKGGGVQSVNQGTGNPNECSSSVSISTIEVMNGLVSLVYQGTMPEVGQESMDALLVLHEPEVINKWNPDSPVPTFWDVSSQLIFSISQRLINRQITNYTELLMWLKEILRRKNSFLSMHRENANQGSELPICRQAAIKLEVVFFIYMWSIDLEAGLVSMSCFGLLCEEADIRVGSDDYPGTYLVPNYQVYQELTHSSTLLTPGRAALQKRIMAILRKIDHCTQGIFQAWEDTMASWNASIKEILSYPKKHGKESTDDSDRTRPQEGGTLHRTVSKRRTSSYYTTDHEVEDQFNEWVNMTGFLCSLGGITLQKKSPPPVSANTTILDRKAPYTALDRKAPYTVLDRKGPHTVLDRNPPYTVLDRNPPFNYSQESAQPVTLFIHHLLRLLVVQNERFGTQIQKHVKELLSHELSPTLYPILFDQIKSIVDGFFDSEPPNKQHVNESDTNTQFINHIMYILRCVLEKEQASEHLGVNSIESTILNIVKYLRHLDSNLINVVQMKTKFCFLIVAIMNRREDLSLRQEMRFRNKLVEYITDWVMGNSHAQAQYLTTPELNLYLRDLDHAAMMSVASLLRQLPLQPEESDRGDLMSAKSSLFLKYFSLFMKIIEDCCEPNLNEEDLFRDMSRFTLYRDRDGTSKTSELRSYTIQAMANLLSSNIDSGLADSLALGYHRDYLTRVAFLEVITKCLEEGTEFEMLADTVLQDRYEQLVQLVTMIGDKGELPIAMALAQVVVTSQMDELARVFVTLFDAKHLLPSLLWNIFYKEVELLDCMKTLFRGNSLGSKIMSFCFKIYGTEYLKSLLEPLILPLTCEEKESICYEIDPNRVPEGECVLEENRRNLLTLTKRVYDSIIGSTDRFPPQLRSMCHCLFQVLNKRFHGNQPGNISAVGTVIFLRFINPAIVSPFESGIIDSEPSAKVKRGLMLMSKILQNIANHVEFSKEQHMKYFNDFIKENFDTTRQWVLQITSDCDQTEHPMLTPCQGQSSGHWHSSHGQTLNPYIGSHNAAMISGINISALHRLLHSHQDKMSDYLSSSRDNKAVGRRPFDRMVTLLAYLGPPEDHKTALEHSWDQGQVESSQFEQLMTELKMNELDDFKELKASNIFYQAGTSKAGNPVFYYIARRYNVTTTNCDLLIYLVLLTLKPVHNKHFELVVDLTHATAFNRFRKEVLRKWFMVLPEAIGDRCKACYVYNCNSWVREYTKYHDAFHVVRNNRKIIYLENLAKLTEYIDGDEQKLPGHTLSLEEDLKVWTGALRLSHKDTKVVVKVGPGHLSIVSAEKAKVLGHSSVYLNDIYQAVELDEVCLVDEAQFTLKINDTRGQPTTLSIIHSECESIVANIIRIRTRWELSQPDSAPVHTKIKPKDVPGTLLNMALLNLGSSESTLRSAAYNLLLTLMQSFHLEIPSEILSDLSIFTSTNSYMSGDLNRDNLIQVICRLSDTLAISASHLTLEFLEESIHGYECSDLHHKQLCLNYMIPWLTNLTRFRKHSDGHKRSKVNVILDKLVDMTKIDPALRPKIFPLLRRMRAQHEPRNANSGITSNTTSAISPAPTPSGSTCINNSSKSPNVETTDSSHQGTRTMLSVQSTDSLPPQSQHFITPSVSQDFPFIPDSPDE